MTIVMPLDETKNPLLRRSGTNTKERVKQRRIEFSSKVKDLIKTSLSPRDGPKEEDASHKSEERSINHKRRSGNSSQLRASGSQKSQLLVPNTKEMHRKASFIQTQALDSLATQKAPSKKKSFQEKQETSAKRPGSPQQVLKKSTLGLVYSSRPPQKRSQEETKNHSDENFLRTATVDKSRAAKSSDRSVASQQHHERPLHPHHVAHTSPRAPYAPSGFKKNMTRRLSIKPQSFTRKKNTIIPSQQRRESRTKGVAVEVQSPEEHFIETYLREHIKQATERLEQEDSQADLVEFADPTDLM